MPSELISWLRKPRIWFICILFLWSKGISLLWSSSISWWETQIMTPKYSLNVILHLFPLNDLKVVPGEETQITILEHSFLVTVIGSYRSNQFGYIYNSSFLRCKLKKRGSAVLWGSNSHAFIMVLLALMILILLSDRLCCWMRWRSSFFRIIPLSTQGLSRKGLVLYTVILYIYRLLHE